MGTRSDFFLFLPISLSLPLHRMLQLKFPHHCLAERIKVFAVLLPYPVDDLQVDLFVFMHDPVPEADHLYHLLRQLWADHFFLCQGLEYRGLRAWNFPSGGVRRKLGTHPIFSLFDLCGIVSSKRLYNLYFLTTALQNVSRSLLFFCQTLWTIFNLS